LAYFALEKHHQPRGRGVPLPAPPVAVYVHAHICPTLFANTQILSHTHAPRSTATVEKFVHNFARRKYALVLEEQKAGKSMTGHMPHPMPAGSPLYTCFVCGLSSRCAVVLVVLLVPMPGYHPMLFPTLICILN